MYIYLRKQLLYLKVNAFCYFDNLFGDSREIIVKHRILNLACLIIAISYIFRILINQSFGFIHFMQLLNNIISIFSILCVFYISRFLKRIKTARMLFPAIILVNLSMSWIYTGGTIGVIPYYFLWSFLIIVFIYKYNSRILVLSLVVIDITLLFLLEHSDKYIDINNTYLDEYSLSKIKYYNLLLILSLTVIMVYISDWFYRIDKVIKSESTLNIEDHNNYNAKINEIAPKLTQQERRVLELISAGKSNKEIASTLFINVCTVKTHTNNIFKKIGVSKRRDIVTLPSYTKS